MKMLYVNDFFTNSSSYSRRLEGKIPIIIKLGSLTILIFNVSSANCNLRIIINFRIEI